ncbi:metal ABC transporter solute-binding protein, Zn/Mn family [Palaeococcus ferrophilus]|uniref:metal ABC transporter solute-binding protein, Zn/Mn family n=1 Tax=Palaeococcus ferrophilus TaxID=83868 RepID=UPI00064ECE84|nr:zinc ABC transporter substrate-binding protein [Palaeococcus ferrophilus]
MRRAVFLLMVLILLSGIPWARAEKPVVIVSIAPLGEIVKEALGDSVEVEVLVPMGVDPHEYQLTPEQVEKARRAAVIVTTGGHLPAEKKLRELEGNGEIEARVLWLDDYTRYGFRFLNKGWMEGRNEHGTWMDPTNALAIARATVEALSEADPSNAPSYMEAYSSFEKRVEEIVDAYSEVFERLGKESAVVELPAHQYVLEWMGVESVAAVKPEEELPAREVDSLLPVAEKADLIVYTSSSPDSLREAALELSKRSGKPIADVTYMWSGKPYTTVLEENAASVIAALAKGEKERVVRGSGGLSPIYVLLGGIVGLTFGFAIGTFLRE